MNECEHVIVYDEMPYNDVLGKKRAWQKTTTKKPNKQKLTSVLLHPSSSSLDVSGLFVVCVISFIQDWSSALTSPVLPDVVELSGTVSEDALEAVSYTHLRAHET